MIKTVFLDRDGVINRERGTYTWRIEDFEFLPGLFDKLKEFIQQGYQIIVVTNQGGIAKGMYSMEEFRKLNNWMHEQFVKNQIAVLQTYFSPDHDDHTKSLSRKPAGILFERAIAKYNVDVSQSVMIGDSQRDIEAAEKNGIKGILIEANTSLKDVTF